MSDQNNLPARSARHTKDSEFNRIWRYRYDTKRKVELSEYEEELHLRWTTIWNLLTGKILNDRKVILAYLTWCKENNIDISERTAYDDLKRSKMLFGDPSLNTHVFEKARMSNVLLDQMEELKKIQEHATDSDKIEAAKVFNQLIRRYNATNGLEEDLNLHVPRAPITIVFNADPEVLKKQAAELMEGVEDADFTEV